MHPNHIRYHRNVRRLGFAFWLNISLVVVWTAMLPITLMTGLKASVPFIAAISIYSLMITHLVGALAAIAGQTSSENATHLPAPKEIE